MEAGSLAFRLYKDQIIPLRQEHAVRSRRAPRSEFFLRSLSAFVSSLRSRPGTERSACSISRWPDTRWVAEVGCSRDCGEPW